MICYDPLRPFDMSLIHVYHASLDRLAPKDMLNSRI